LTVESKSGERLPGGRREAWPHEGEQLLENVLVVFPVPLPGQLAAGVFELREKSFDLRAAARQRLLAPRLVKGPGAVDRDLP
jgi:hypothetical protein